MSPRDAGSARTVLSVRLPGGLGGGPIRIALVGVGEPLLGDWIAAHAQSLRIRRLVRGPVEAELTLAGATRSTGAVTAPAIHHPPPLRWHRDRPDTVRCGGARLRLTEGIEDLLTVPAGSGDGDPGTVRPLLDLWLGRVLALRGVALLHATAFQVGRRRVVAFGGSGAGKSTLAAAVLGIGGRVVSDDLVMAGVVARNGLLLAPSRRLLAFRPASVALLPARLRERLQRWPDPADERWILPWRGMARSSIEAMRQPQTLWEVTIDRRLRSSRIAAISQAQALVALLRSTPLLFLSSGFARERTALLPVLQRLASACRGYRVRLGADLLREPDRCLRRLLAEAQ